MILQSIFENRFKTSKTDKVVSPFWVLVSKEIYDHIRSWRFLILLSIIILASSASLYTSISKLSQQLNTLDANKEGFLFLKVFTLSDGALPPFHVFVSFLGPLLGIAMGFDAVSSEYTNNTLSRVLSQPIYRDNLINAKFIASFIVICVLFLFLGGMTLGSSVLILGQFPSFVEFFRIFAFLLVAIVYVAFWLNLSVFFSIVFKQAATSALICIAVWLFFTIFYPMIVNIVAQAIMPSPYATEREVINFQNTVLGMMRFAPSQLFMDATTILLNPTVRSLGPLTMEQVDGAIPSSLPVMESIKVVWAQMTALIASSSFCFVLSYYFFMRKEVRS